MIIVGTFTSQIFSPPKITGLSLWLDAADTRTITASPTLVTQWRDKSTNSFHVNQLGTTPPSTNVNTRNGQNVITHTGASGALSNSSNSLFRNVSGFAWYVVTNTTQEVFGRILHKDVTPTNVANRAGIVSRRIGSSYEGLARRVNTDTLSAVASTTISNSSWRLVGQLVNYSLGSNSIRVNGVTENTTTVPAGVSEDIDGGSITIGANTNLSQFFVGNIAEVVAYSKNLSAAELNSLETYLSQKWAI